MQSPIIETISTIGGTILKISIVVLAGFVLASTGCDYFQRKEYTRDDREVPLSRLAELCLKANDKGPGGNVLHCQALLNALEPSGQIDIQKKRLDAFIDCVEKKDSKKLSSVNCKKLFLPPEPVTEED